MIAQPASSHQLIDQRFAAHGEVIDLLSDDRLTEAALVANRLASINEQMSAEWAEVPLQVESSDGEPCLPEGASSILVDRAGRRWCVSHRFNSKLVRLAPLQSGHPPLIPGIRATALTYESLDERLAAGQSWCCAFQWPGTPAAAWLEVSGTLQAAEVSLAIPERVASPDDTRVVWIYRAPEEPVVMGFRHRMISVRADKGGPNAHWRFFSQEEGFKDIHPGDRRELRFALVQLGRLFPPRRASTHTTIEKVSCCGEPPPEALEAYLHPLNETELLGALLKAIR